LSEDTKQIDFSSSSVTTSSLLHLEDKDLLQIDATVIAGVLVLSTVGALKLNITVIAWIASTVIWFSFSAFVILLTRIVKPDVSTDDHEIKTNQVMARNRIYGWRTCLSNWCHLDIFHCEFVPFDEVGP